MSAGIYNILLSRGESFIRRFTYTDVDSNPVNISDYLAHLTVRQGKDYSQPALWDIYGGPVSFPAPLSAVPIPNLSIWGIAGQITLYVPASQAIFFPWDTANYDLFLTTPTGFSFKLLTGAINILPSIVHT